MNDAKGLNDEKDYVISVNDLPLSERPRERLRELGADKLSSAELIALLLNTGTRGESVITLAQKILVRFGSLSMIMEASLEDLKNFRGLGEAKASKLMASFGIARKIIREIQENENESRLNRKKYNPITNPEELHRILISKITNYSKEHFYVISLDSRNNFTGLDEISVGTLTASLVHPRETFESAIRRHAAHIIIAHNHPSGETDPSEDDLKITRRLVEAGKIMGIDVLDHLIFTKHSYMSFKESSLI
ncbi:MAG: DNA repair protein RadC [Bacteroidetes bacterium]|nr:DNA repair protein RadC [Bacteroidota bacterium]